MNIQQSINYLEWRFTKSNLKPTEKDIKAYNAIIDYKEQQESLNMVNNESMAKLWMHLFIDYSRKGFSSASEIIKQIDFILGFDTFNMVKLVQNEILSARIQKVGLKKYPHLKGNDVFNLTKQKERTDAIFKEFEPDIVSVLKTEVSEDKTLKFIKEQITRVLDKFEH